MLFASQYHIVHVPPRNCLECREYLPLQLPIVSYACCMRSMRLLELDPRHLVTRTTTVFRHSMHLPVSVLPYDTKSYGVIHHISHNDNVNHSHAYDGLVSNNCSINSDHLPYRIVLPVAAPPNLDISRYNFRRYSSDNGLVPA